MAQYYQVTSLEEFRKLYPNIQLENLEGIPCMIQDDQITQYTDGQGQQVIATVEQSGIQLSCNPCSTQQCSSQQPTKYVIQQMDSNEPQSSTVQYIQHKQQSAQTNDEIPFGQFKDQSERSINTNVGGDEHSLQHCLIKQDNTQQYLPQVQPVLQQHIQIHPQIQAVDMAGNVLVLQNQEQQDFLINQNESQNVLSNTIEKQHQQSPQHILIHRSHQPKSQEIITQKQIIQQSENSQECSQHQILQSSHEPHSGGQQQQIVHQPQQRIIQPLQYFNQVTVIDNFSQPRVTIEHHPLTNENLLQVQPHIQQQRSKKNLQQSNLSAIIQQPQVLVPQRFEISSPPPLANTMFQSNKKTSQDIERPTAPVFIVQKVDSPFFIRQHQAKIRFQSPQQNNEKKNENSYQSASTLNEQSVVENKTQGHNPVIPASVTSQPSEILANINVTSSLSQLQSNKCSLDRNFSNNQVKIGIIEQSFETRPADQINKPKLCTPLSVRTPVAKIKTNEQQTDSTGGSDGKEMGIHQFQKFGINSESQTRQTPGLSSHIQSPVDIHNPGQIPNRGRIIRPPLPRGQQFAPRVRGSQVQTSPARLPNTERGGICKKVKYPRGGGKVGRGGWTPCGPDQRQVPLVRAGIQQIAQTTSPKNETSQTSNEVMEEARMMVLLINGEKKIVKIPCSQNILLGQILQQAGLSVTPQTPITIEQVGENSVDHLGIKSNSLNSPQLSVGFKQSNIPNSSGTPRSIVATIQQRPRVQSPYTTQVSNMGIVKNRPAFVNPRVSSPNYSGSSSVTSNVVTETSQSQNTPNSTPLQTPAKEESRFVSGLMAICPFCGISSLDFNRCIRCRRKLPENVKAQSIFSVKKKEKTSVGSEKQEECKSDSEEKHSESCRTENKDKNSLLQGNEKKKPKPCVKKKKISDEPTEILILSSDEEEESKVKKTNLNATTLSVLKKEPVYTDTLGETEMINLLQESNLNEDLMKNVLPGSCTTLQCRTVRIGSYKVQPKERVFISAKGIRMVINSLKNEHVAVIIPIGDILKILIHFGKQIPVIFIYPVPKIGCHIRDLLGMENKMGPYYDPTSTQEETHKRITLLLEKITEDNKTAINKIFRPDKIEELSEKEANEILIRASPLETHNSCILKPTDSVKKILVYPPPPEKGGITLNNQDYACLGEDQFLNDVIIDFYLKYLMLEILSPTDRNRTHVFSTFFYKRLTTKPKTLRKNDPENDPKLSPAEKRHMRVKGWTKQVNLFEKDFIIVPINEHSHWFLAIICFPGLTGPVRFSDNTPVEPEEITKKKNSQTVQIGNTTITHIIKSDGNTISLEMDSGSDRDEAEGDQDDLHPSSDDEGNEQVEEPNTSSPVQIPLLSPVSQPQQTGLKDSKSKLTRRKSYKEPIKQPCILIFDSLAGASRVRVVATLRDYLKIEYKKKMGQDRDFSKDTIKGAVPKVPQQNNFTDCGLYVLQYVESFFQDPLHDFKLPLKYLHDWFPEEIVSSKRQKLASLIRSLMEEQGIKVEDIGLPVLTFTSGNSAADEQSRTEDDEVDDAEEFNEEDEEMLRSRVQISEFENEDEEEEDLNLEDEDQMDDDNDNDEDDDDDDDEDEEDEDEELDDEIEDEELEVGEIPRQWLTRARGSCCELKTSVKHGRPVVFKTTALVEYEPSDSDDDSSAFPHDSVVLRETQRNVSTKTLEERDYCESNEAVVSERRKSVPLTEYQDFESQISCTTIERNLDSKNNESNVIICEEDEVGEHNRIADEEPSFEISGAEKTSVMSDNFSQSVEKTYGPKELIIKDDKAIKVTDIIKKLVNDKNITISRKEDEINSSFFKKHLDVKKFKVIDCDKGEESEKVTSPSSAPNTNLGNYKRSYQTLKSIRIPKKAERNLELCCKRQKVDER